MKSAEAGILIMLGFMVPLEEIIRLIFHYNLPHFKDLLLVSIKQTLSVPSH